MKPGPWRTPTPPGGPAELLPNRVCQQCFSRICEHVCRPATIIPPRLPRNLNPRLVETLILVSKGLGNAEIGARMGTSGEVICVYFGRLFKRLGLTDRNECALWALDHMELLTGLAQPVKPAKQTPLYDELVRGLTPRRGQVLAMVAHGLSNKDIAGALGVEVVCVKGAVQELFVLFGFESRLECALFARRYLHLLRPAPVEAPAAGASFEWPREVPGRSSKCRTWRIFTNSLDTVQGVAKYSALCDLPAYSASEAISRINPAMGQPPWHPIVAIESPPVFPDSLSWLAVHT